MDSSTIVILGIPVDNLDLDEAVDRIFSMVDAYGEDGVPRQVATVNVDFVVNTLTWHPGRIRHPELIDILRRADLVTADGMPIVWMSRLIGNPLKERVTGADLVPRLAEEAARRKKSIYFLGGRGDVGRRAADILASRYPGLKIAGVDSPFVHVDGRELEWAEEVDVPIIERINRSGADILLIAFGNPKQEVWFDRNRNRLKVPVSIGIGGTYEFIVGSVARAPQWLQKTGFEWVFRITQEPRRLWKRYFVGFFKFGLMVAPTILYYRYQRLVNRLGNRKDLSGRQQPEVSLISNQSLIRVVKLPDRFDAAFLDGAKKDIEAMLERISNTVLDFSRTSFIDSAGMGFIIKLWRYARKENKGLYLFGVDGTVINFFRVNRLWDLFKDKVCENLDEIFDILKEDRPLPPFYFVTESERGFMLIRLYGRLDAAQMSALDLESILEDLGDRDCILDLKGLDFVDSSGLIFFIKIQKHLMNNNKKFIMCDISDNVKQMFRITKLIQLFRIVPDIASAEKELENLL